MIRLSTSCTACFIFISLIVATVSAAEQETNE